MRESLFAKVGFAVEFRAKTKLGLGVCTTTRRGSLLAPNSDLEHKSEKQRGEMSFRVCYRVPN